jgi:RHS repeat-associated protein
MTRELGLTTNSVSIAYDPIAEVTSWAAKESNGTSRENEQLSYAYDAASNLHLRTNNSLVQTFTVDTLNQLSNVTHSGTLTVSGALPAPAANVTVDGNVAQTNGDFTFAATGITGSNGANTFTIIAENVYGTNVTNTLSVNLPATVVLQYDANGNLTNDGTRSFFYDAENQLTNVVVSNQWQAGFVYDGFGLRRIKRQYTWQSSTWSLTNEVHYIYDGSLVIQERDTNDNVLVTYTRGLDLSGSLQGAGGIGGLLARTDTNGTTYYHFDGNGNVTALINAYGLIVARYEYDAYGRLIGQWGSLASTNAYRFSSKEYDSLTGLYYYGHRYYDPTLQRFLNHDTIGEAGGINLYGFVGNNPVNEVDPYGLWIWFGWFRSSPPSQPAQSADPNSYGAMRAAMIGDPSDNNFNGETGAQVAQDIGMAVPKGILNTAAMMLGPGEAEGAYAAADEALQAARAARAVSKAKCFKSFGALKRAMPNTPGNVWHHIVEQSQEGRFGADAIQNANNVMEVSPELNQALNKLYSSIQPDITGSDSLTVRQWLSTQTYNQAQDFGRRAVANVSAGVWP